MTWPAISDGTISSTTAKAPASSHGVRIGEQLVGAFVTATLDDVAAETVLALRGEPDVRHHRDAGTDDPLDLLGAAHAALALHRVATRSPS